MGLLAAMNTIDVPEVEFIPNTRTFSNEPCNETVTLLTPKLSEKH